MSTMNDILDIWKDRKISNKEILNILKYSFKFGARIIVIWFICSYIMFIPKH